MNLRRKYGARIARPVIDFFRTHPAWTPVATPRFQLPFNTETPYRTVISTAQALGILMNESTEAECIACYYTQIYFPDEKLRSKHNDHMVAFVPYMHPDDWVLLKSLQCSDYSHLLRNSDSMLCSSIAENLLAGKYCSFIANDYYIPGTRFYGKRDGTHQLLVFGFDRYGASLDVATYVGNKMGKIDIDIVAFLRGIKSRCRISRGFFSGSTSLRYWTLHVNPAHRPRADRNIIVNQLKDYLDGVDRLPQYSTLRFRNPCQSQTGTWGAKTYPSFEYYFNSCAEGELAVDFRVSRLFWEHKRIMRIRLEHLEQLGILVESEGISRAYRRVEGLGYAIHVYFVKYAESRQGALITAILNNVRQAEQVELPLLQQALTRLAGTS